MSGEKRGSEKRDAIEHTAREWRDHQKLVSGKDPGDRAAREQVRDGFARNERRNEERKGRG